MDVVLCALHEIDPVQRRAAEAEIHRRLDHEPHTILPVLLTALSDGDPAAQLMGVLVLKHFVGTHWRTTSLTHERKLELRSELFRLLTDASFTTRTSPNVTLQLCLAVARIARVDYPHAWPHVFQDMASHICLGAGSSSSNPMLLLTHRVLLELHSRALDHRAFATLCHNLHGLVMPLWAAAVDDFLARDLKDASDLILVCKILRRVVGYGTEAYTADIVQPIVMAFLALLGKARTTHPDHSGLENALHHVAKLLKTCAAQHSVGFAPVVVPVARVAFDVLCDTQDPASWFYRRVIIQMVLLLKVCVDNAKCCREFEAGVASLPLRDLMRVLIERCLRMGEGDTELWDSDAEEFVASQDMDEEKEDNDEDGENKGRGCDVKGHAEELFLTIAAYSEAIAAAIPGDIQSMLASGTPVVQESALCALGLCWFQVRDFIDPASLLPVLLGYVSSGAHRAVQRRALWVVGRWSENVTDRTQRRNVHGAVVGVMCATHADPVLRLTALLCVGEYLGDPQFDPSELMENVGVFLPTFLEITRRMQNYELRLRALTILGSVLRRLGGYVHSAPDLVPTVITILRGMWAADAMRSHESNPVVRVGVLDTLRMALTIPLDSNSRQQLDDICMGLIEGSLDGDRPEHLWLQDPATILWATLLENSPGPHPSYYRLLRSAMPSALERSFDEYGTLLSCITASVIMCPQAVQDSGCLAALVEKVADVVLNLRGEGLRRSVQCISMMVLAFPGAGDHLGGFLRDAVGQVMSVDEDDSDMYCHIVPGMLPAIFRLAALCPRPVRMECDVAAFLSKYLDLVDFVQHPYDKTVCAIGAAVVYDMYRLHDPALRASVGLVVQGEAIRDPAALVDAFVCSHVRDAADTCHRQRLAQLASTADPLLQRLREL